MQLKQTSFKENCFSFFFYCAVYRKFTLKNKTADCLPKMNFESSQFLSFSSTDEAFRA